MYQISYKITSNFISTKSVRIYQEIPRISNDIIGNSKDTNGPLPISL